MPIDFPSNPTLNQIFSTNTKSWIYGTAGWKAYDVQGTVANNSVRQTTATSGQTLFTVPNYVQGQNQIRVFINGVRQNNVVDFSETSTSSITLTSPATLGDNVAFEVITYAGTPVFTGVYPTIIDDTTTNATRYPLLAQGTGGSLSIVNTDSTGLSFNPSTGTLTVGSLTFGDGTTQSTTALALAQAAYGEANAESAINNTQNTNITAVNTFAQAAYTQANTVPTNINTRGIQTNASYFPTFVDANNATNASETVHTHANYSFNPSTGALSATSFSGTANNATYWAGYTTTTLLYGGSWSSWYAGQVAHDQLGSYAYLGYAAASTTAITAGTNQAGSGLRFWGSAGAVGATQVSTAAVGATPSGTWKPVGTVTQTTSLVKHSVWVRVA